MPFVNPYLEYSCLQISSLSTLSKPLSFSQIHLWDSERFWFRFLFRSSTATTICTSSISLILISSECLISISISISKLHRHHHRDSERFRFWSSTATTVCTGSISLISISSESLISKLHGHHHLHQRGIDSLSLTSSSFRLSGFGYWNWNCKQETTSWFVSKHILFFFSSLSTSLN